VNTCPYGDVSKTSNYSVASGDSDNRRNEGALCPEMSRLGAEGLNAAARWERFPCPFVKTLENKKSFEITLRLNSYKNKQGRFSIRQFFRGFAKHI
jgi:hypothetical protein